MKEKAKKLEKAFEGLHKDAKDSMSGLEKLIEKNAMDPVEVAELIDNKMEADIMHPELANIEKMTSTDFAALYKKMAEELENIVAAGQMGKPVIKFENALLGALNQPAGQNTAAAPQAAPVQEAPRPKFCPNCGAPAEGGKFCQHCGSPL